MSLEHITATSNFCNKMWYWCNLEIYGMRLNHSAFMLESVTCSVALFSFFFFLLSTYRSESN